MTLPVLKVMWRAPASGFHCVCVCVSRGAQGTASTVYTPKHCVENEERFSLVIALNLTQIQMCYFLIGYYGPFLFSFFFIGW